MTCILLLSLVKALARLNERQDLLIRRVHQKRPWLHLEGILGKCLSVRSTRMNRPDHDVALGEIA